jgi:hypothetical protein
MAGSVLSGYVMAALRADQQWQQLSPQPGLASGDVREDLALPFLLVNDREEHSHWVVPPTSRFVVHRLTVQIHNTGAAAAGAENPAEVLAAHVERILNGIDLVIPGAIAQYFLQAKHVLSEEKQRADSKARVYRVELEWEVGLERNA